MRGPTHLTCGLASWAVVDTLTVRPTLTGVAAGGLAAAAGALLPDLDQRWPWRALTGGHRHATHSLVGLTVVTGLAAAVMPFIHMPFLIVLALATGYLSHIATDSMTIRGCPWLWPNLTRFWLLPDGWRVTTGGKRIYHHGLRMAVRRPAYGEVVIGACFVTAALASMYWRILH